MQIWPAGASMAFFKKESFKFIHLFLQKSNNFPPFHSYSTQLFYSTNYKNIFLNIFCYSGQVSLSTLIFSTLQYCTMILQRIRTIVGNYGFEPGTSAQEVWRTTNEPPHLLKLCEDNSLVARELLITLL